MHDSLAKAQEYLAGAPSESLHCSQWVEERPGPHIVHTGPAGACPCWSSMKASLLKGPSINRVHLV
jgi:hypothetical protein